VFFFRRRANDGRKGRSWPFQITNAPTPSNEESSPKATFKQPRFLLVLVVIDRQQGVLAGKTTNLLG
jgi:hypothetical protein